MAAAPRSVVLLSLTLSWLGLLLASQGAPRPNILFIQTDDQGPWALEGEHPQASTPHMRRLFSEGLRLTRCFTVTPVCSPSRAGLMTSRYGSELGITDWINPRTEPDQGLDPNLPNWVRILRSHGYQTGLVGKWHLGTADKFHPLNQGFDDFFGHRAGGWSPENPVLEKDGVDVALSGLTTDILGDAVIDYLRSRRIDRPFLLCWHTRAPHARWLPVAEEDWAPFAHADPEVPEPDYPSLDTAKVKRVTREYLASVRGVDRNLGRVLQSLDDLGLRDNTIVILTSDHGYNMGHHGIWHKGNGHWILKDPPSGTANVPRGQRPNLFEESLQVPTAIRWPGVIPPGSVHAGTVTQLDWFPTLLEMAGVPLPDNLTLRGRAIPYRSPSSQESPEPLFLQYSTHHQSRTHMRGLRTPEWKLIRDFLNPSRDELYHLSSDPRESANLIASADPAVRRIRQQLHGQLLTKMRAIQDPAVPQNLQLTNIAGSGEPAYGGDGEPAVQAQLNQPFGLVKGPDQCLYVCDTGNHAIRKIDPQGIITTVAGTGEPGYSGDGGPATHAKLFEPYEVRFDAHGHLFFVEMRNHLIRRVDGRTGLISTLAGDGTPGVSGDGGPAALARFNRPHSIQFGPAGHLYICDIGNHRLRRINMDTGIIDTFSGTGEAALPQDGQAFAQAPLLGPRALDFDHRGRLWLALREGNRLYEFDLQRGTLHWRAGTGETGFTGHGGPAKEAALSGPKGVSAGPDGRIYLADTESHSLRVYHPRNGVLTLLAGTGDPGDGPTGDPALARLARPHGVYADAEGRIYIGDSETHRVRVIAAIDAPETE